MTTWTLRKGEAEKSRADVVVVGVHQGGKGPTIAPQGAELAKVFGRRFAPLLAAMRVTGKAGEAVRVPVGDRLPSQVLLLVGLGPAESLTSEAVRRAAGVAARHVGNAASVALALPAEDATYVRAVVEGFHAGGYRTPKSHPGQASGKSRRQRGQDDVAEVAEVAVLSPTARQRASAEALESARVVSVLADAARDWVNTPPNLLGPEELADAAVALRSAGSKSRRAVEVTVHDDDQLAEMGCGGILGVSAGSSRPARLVRLDYRPKGLAEDAPHVAFVGKGITYDSGGLTIKPGASMKTMKNDMAGAAAVIAATYAIAELELPIAVTTFAPLAENMISGAAMRPGDVLTLRGGTTVEVRNTDAEGRLVLADALALAAEESPDTIVEISTLTGPCVVALGDRIAGLFGDDETVAEMDAVGTAVGEPMWHLPIPAETTEAIRTESEVADLLQHNWVRWGSALWAAGFLQEFVDGLPWVHLDIAGPAWNSGAARGHVPAGATGFGVRSLVELAARRAAGPSVTFSSV